MSPINPKKYEAGLREAKAFIEREYRRFPSMQDVADGLGVSDNYFQKLFKARYGYTPGSLLRKLRRAEGLSCNNLAQRKPDSRPLPPEDRKHRITIAARRLGLPKPRYGWIVGNEYAGRNAKEAISYMGKKGEAA